jgi:hypothetical protein
MTGSVPDLNEVIDQHLAALAKPGVLSVRPGYKAVGGWLTDQPAIVVTVGEKVPQPPAADILPTRVGGVPVDVRQASALKRTELQPAAGVRCKARTCLA